jgi:hypothetical protein
MSAPSETSAQLVQAFRDPKQVEALDEDIPEDQETGDPSLSDRLHGASDHHRIRGEVNDLELTRSTDRSDAPGWMFLRRRSSASGVPIGSNMS